MSVAKESVRLTLRPCGRGNWRTITLDITGRWSEPRGVWSEPLVQHPGDVVQVLGRQWRVVEVAPITETARP